jgi:hypothetical protein
MEGKEGAMVMTGIVDGRKQDQNVIGWMDLKALGAVDTRFEPLKTEAIFSMFFLNQKSTGRF